MRHPQNNTLQTKVGMCFLLHFILGCRLLSFVQFRLPRVETNWPPGGTRGAPPGTVVPALDPVLNETAPVLHAGVSRFFATRAELGHSKYRFRMRKESSNTGTPISVMQGNAIAVSWCLFMLRTGNSHSP